MARSTYHPDVYGTFYLPLNRAKTCSTYHHDTLYLPGFWCIAASTYHLKRVLG